MTHSLRRSFVHFVVASLVFMGFAQTSQAALIGTEQVARTASGQSDRARILSQLDRPDVVAELEKHGVKKQDAQARVNALTDEEATIVAQQIDSAPAGGSSVLGVIVLIFLVLLVTDILGLTKVFPFTGSVR